MAENQAQVQGKTKVEKVLMDVGKRVLKYYEDDEVIAIDDVHYPLYPYRNYWLNSYMINKREKRLKLMYVHDTWNGTGAETKINVPLTDEEFELMMNTLRRVTRFKHVDVLDELFRIFNRCKVDDDCDERINEIRELASKIA